MYPCLKIGSWGLAFREHAANLSAREIGWWQCQLATRWTTARSAGMEGISKLHGPTFCLQRRITKGAMLWGGDWWRVNSGKLPILPSCWFQMGITSARWGTKYEHTINCSMFFSSKSTQRMVTCSRRKQQCKNSECNSGICVAEKWLFSCHSGWLKQHNRSRETLRVLLKLLLM